MKTPKTRKWHAGITHCKVVLACDVKIIFVNPLQIVFKAGYSSEASNSNCQM